MSNNPNGYNQYKGGGGAGSGKDSQHAAITSSDGRIGFGVQGGRTPANVKSGPRADPHVNNPSGKAGQSKASPALVRARAVVALNNRPMGPKTGRGISGTRPYSTGRP